MTLPQTSAPSAGDDDQLSSSLVELSRLRVSQMGLDELLTRVASLVVRAIPGADGAGLTLIEDGHGDTIVATAPFVQEVDAIQYEMRQGPCISAAATSQTMVSGSLGSDPRWPQFGGRVARLGVHSVLSLPLITPEQVVGAMNVYAHAKDVFGERSAELGELFAAPAAIAVQNAQVLAQTQRLAARLQSALENRGVIDRAVGIIMSRSGGTEQAALERLRTLSQQEHRKISVIARQMVDEAVRRVETRRQTDRK